MRRSLRRTFFPPWTIRPISLVLDPRSFSINSKQESCAVLNSTWSISPWLHLTCLFCFYIFPKYHTMAKIKGTEESIPHLLLPLIVSYTRLILVLRMWIKTNVFFSRAHLYITDKGVTVVAKWLFTISKKVPEILVRNFHSVITARVVYHLPKISGLSRRARLDSSYNMKLVRNSRNL